MTFLMLCAFLYFLPSIIGHNERSAVGIFLFNLFLGLDVHRLDHRSDLGVHG